MSKITATNEDNVLYMWSFFQWLLYRVMRMCRLIYDEAQLKH